MKTFIGMMVIAGLAAGQQITLVGEENKEQTCWLRAEGRGVGVPISSCPADKEKDGLLCYPLCRDNFDGVGPVCW